MTPSPSGGGTLEVPVDSVASAEVAMPHADRIELCDDLATEGWTPGQPLVREVRRLSDARPPHARPRIVAMIRPRLPESTLSLDAVAFAATARIVEASLADIARAADAGAHEVAIGLLDAHGRIDCAACATLRDAAVSRGLDVAFLRVFDLLEDRAQGWRDLAALGMRRVLTAAVRGWDASVSPVSDRVRLLQDDVRCAQEAAGNAGTGPIAIAAGGGVRASNARAFLEATPHLHASCRVQGAISAAELAAIRARMSELS